jgi:hypothetical protein
MIDAIEACVRKALRRHESNVAPQGILAARRSAAAQKRRDTRVFARDAGVCACRRWGEASWRSGRR